MPFSNALGYVPNIALSAAAATSAPLPREVGNRVQNQPPSAEVQMPAAAMPFAAAMAVGAAYPGVPVPVTPSAAKMAVKTAAVPLSAPAVVSGVADARGWLSVTEPSIVRPAAENVKTVHPGNCAADCGSKVGTIAPAELPARTSVRPEAADTTNNRPVAFVPNRNQAIVETTTGKVRVVPGDSLWKLAARYLGNGLRWKQLAALNPQLVNPNHIQVGDWIQIPSEPKQTAKHVIIQPGDTLWRVARTTLGSSLALSCLVHANPKIHSVDQVLAGETLVVPSTCSNLESTQN
jgi:nucleoid-associated protein YgaU